MARETNNWYSRNCCQKMYIRRRVVLITLRRLIRLDRNREEKCLLKDTCHERYIEPLLNVKGKVAIFNLGIRFFIYFVVSISSMLFKVDKR